MKRPNFNIFAALLGAVLLSACGGGGGGSGGSPATETQRPQSRVVVCQTCLPEQLQALGGNAVNAQPGSDITVTLALTQTEYDEINAWLNGRSLSNPPEALCRETLYQQHTETHDDLADTEKWAIVRNGITLHADGRQEHGRYLFSITLFTDEFRERLNVASRALTDARSAAHAKWKAVTDAAGAEIDKIRPRYDSGELTRAEYFAEIKPFRDISDAAWQTLSDELDAIRYGSIAQERERLLSMAFEASKQTHQEHIARHNNLSTSYRAGDIIRVLEKDDYFIDSLETGDYRVITDGISLRLAMPLTLSNGMRANNCNAAPTPRQYYVLESGDNAWKTDRGFAFNMRGILAGNTAIQTDNFLFAHANNLRDLHVELRASPLTLAGIGIYADTGYKSKNEGETQAHYGKLMGVMPLLENDSRFLPALDLYAAASAGKVESDYYENSRLHGFAAGIFARRFLRHNDEWHIRIRQPLAAAEIAEWQFAADARIGESENMLTLGYFRKLHGKSGATILWRREF